MKLVYITFPLGTRNIDEVKVDKYCKYAVDRGFLPITSTLVIKQLEKVCGNRNEYLNKRLELVKRCDEVWIFQDEILYNMVDEIRIAKLFNIPIRYIELKRKINKEEKLFKYKKSLKKVNDILYSGDIYRLRNDFINNLEFEIEVEEDLSEIQKEYLIGKLNSYPLTFGYLDNGYRYIWNLNNNLRNYSLYIRTMYYIKSLEMGNRKMFLMEKMFKSIKHDKLIIEHRKQDIIEKLYRDLEFKNNITAI